MLRHYSTKTTHFPTHIRHMTATTNTTTTSVTAGSKRYGDPLEGAKKKQKTNTHDQNYAFAQVIFHTNYDRAASNSVYVSSSLFKQIFSKNNENNTYLKIDNCVLRAIHDDKLAKDQVDLSNIVFDRIKSRLLAKKIQIYNFDPNTETIANIDMIYLSISAAGQVNTNAGSNHNDVWLFRMPLQELILETLRDEILTLGRSFFVLHPVVGPLKVEILRWSQTKSNNSATDSFHSPLSLYGRLGENTKLSLTTEGDDRLTLVDEEDSDSIEEFTFMVNKVYLIPKRIFTTDSDSTRTHDSWKSDLQPLPMLLPHTEILLKIQEKWNNTFLHLEQCQNFRFENWEYQVELTKVKMQDNVSDQRGEDDYDLRDRNITVFRMQDTHRITVGSQNISKVLIIDTSVPPAIAKMLNFEIIDIDQTYTLGENETIWVSAEDLFRGIRTTEQQIVEDGKIVLLIGLTKYLLTLKNADTNDKIQRNGKIPLKVNDQTEIKIFANSKLNLIIVNSQNPISLESIKIKVSRSDSKNVLIRSLYTVLFKEDSSSKQSITVEEKELHAIFLQKIKRYNSIIYENLTIIGLTGHGHSIDFNIDQLKSHEKDNRPKGFYGDRYAVCPETKIEFISENPKELFITSLPKPINFENVHQRLLEFGIGGMAEGLKDVLAQIHMSRQGFSSHFKMLGLKLPRGFLLYGPPGTGKTLLARKFGELLGVPQDRINMCTGSKVWTKYLGDSEERVREMFNQARDDQKKYGKESPLNLVIIDEIDAFLQDRSNAVRRYERSVVDTFLSELDGISSQGQDSLENIIVVGLTNNLDKIDEAVKRPGRLYPHLHIGLPDAKGRKEIFEIHSKQIKEQGYFASDVHVDAIVTMTTGKSGAYIESLITFAASRTLKRIFSRNLSLENLKTDPAAKITQQDFLTAQSEFENEGMPYKMTQLPAFGQHDVKGIADQLKSIGIGGLSVEILQFLSDLKIYEKYKESFYTMKHPYRRGLFLYGDHGVGKTRLAKALRTLFSLKGQQYQYLKASELWPLSTSQLKEKMIAYLKPAYNASKDLKHEAPLHMIVIDEVENLYKHQDNESILFDKLMSELQSLLDENLEEVRNLLVVGLAYRSPSQPVPLTPQVGRGSVQIHMELPSESGRKEILEIFLKNCMEKVQLQASLDDLAFMTNGFNGAQLESFVSSAITLAMRRAAQHMQPPEKMCLTQQDFIDAKYQITSSSKTLTYFA